MGSFENNSDGTYLKDCCGVPPIFGTMLENEPCKTLATNGMFRTIWIFMEDHLEPFLGPRGPLRVPSFARSSARSSARKKNLNHH